ncbi:hypothetical protein ACHQM5_022100 [Ranunculus cassubicifolius]
MPSKLRKAIGAVKDQTSIGLAKVSTTNKSNLEVAILKATTHEEVPIDDKYANEILFLASSSRAQAATCAHLLSKRLNRKNWIVALKSLVIILRLFQDGDPHFAKEVLLIMKRGSKFLNLANFRDDCNTGAWDYTAFVRSIAVYLNERLECFVTGRLLRRMSGTDNKERDSSEYKSGRERYNEHVRNMKPTMLLDRITYWQILLDKAMRTRPAGAARNNRLVRMCMYAVVKETFDLYRDISDGLALLLDGFFHLPHKVCSNTYRACIYSSEQFEELISFYQVCKEIDVGRPSEYPNVQKISQELMETLQEFLKDQSSFPDEISTPNLNGTCEEYSDSTSEGQTSTQRKQQLSLEDFLSVTDLGTSPSIDDFQSLAGTSPSVSSEQDMRSPVDDLLSLHTAGTSPAMSSLHTAGTSPAMSIDQRNSSAVDLSLFEESNQTWRPFDQDKPPENIEIRPSMNDLLSLQTAGTSSAIDQRSNLLVDLSLFDEINKPSEPSDQDRLSEHTRTLWNVDDEAKQPSTSGQEGKILDEWELMLAETAGDMPSTQNELSIVPFHHQPNNSNPFLVIGNELSIAPSHSQVDSFSSFPTFQATPTFCASNPNGTSENDLFNTPTFCASNPNPNGTDKFNSPTFRASNPNPNGTDKFNSPTFRASNPNPNGTDKFNSSLTFCASNPNPNGTDPFNTPTFCASNPNPNGTDPFNTPTFCASNNPNRTDHFNTPTFCASNLNPNGADLFNTPTFCASNPNSNPKGTNLFNTPAQDTFSQSNLLHEQQVWLQKQNQIIGKHVT